VTGAFQAPLQPIGANRAPPLPRQRRKYTKTGLVWVLLVFRFMASTRHGVGRQRVRTFVRLALAAVAWVSLTTCGGGGGADGEIVVQTSVFGRVLSAVDETPLQGVTVTLADTDDASTTDELGRFMLPLPGAGIYGVTASLEGYTYAQRRTEAAQDELVSVPDMFLTPLDPKEIVIGPEGGRDTNSDGRIEIEVPAGALSETVSMRATWFERGKYLPNFLPQASHFTYACELTPDGQQFAEPATLRMRNERGFAPGTPIPVGVYSPDTLEWTHESMGVVSADGQWVEFEVQHFSPRDCNLGPQDPAGSGEPGDAEDTTDASRRNDQPCGSVAAGSSVDVLDGHLSADHVLPAYQTLSQAWTVGLRYNSNLHSGLPTLGLTYDISQTSTVVPERMRFLVEVGGQRIERFFQPVEGPMDFVHRWDGRDGIGRQLPDGVYTYRLTLANEYEVEFVTVDRFGGDPTGTTGVTADELRGLEATFEGTVVLRRNEPSQISLGAGWGIIGHHHLDTAGDRVFISGGDGNVFVFRPRPDSSFEPTAGNFSTLGRQDTGYLWTRQDRTRVAFDANGRMVTSTDLNGNTISYGYDGAGRLSTRVDPLGGTTTFAYDGAQRLSSITDPHGRATLLRIDDAGDLVRITNPDGSTRNFTYDDAHRLLSQTDAGGHTTTYHYDHAGSVMQVDHPDGSSRAFSSIGAAGSAHLRPGDLGTESNPAPVASSTYTDPERHTYAFTVNTFGTRTSITDPLRRLTLMHRDRNDLLSMQQAPGSEAVHYEYDANGNPRRMSGPSAGAGVRDYYTFNWDPELNVLLSVTDDAAGTTGSAYDAAGNLISADMMDGRHYEFTYDERGLRESATIGGRTTQFRYDDRGNLARVILPTSGSWRFGRDAYGNVTSVTDPDGRVRTAVFNEMNLPESFTNGANDEVQISYAPATGNRASEGIEPSYVISSIRDGRGNSTAFEYDEMYRLRRETDPLSRSHVYAYDGVGRLARHTMSNGRFVQYAYDDAGSLVRKELSTGETSLYTYDEVSGRLASMSNGTCTLTYSYDADGFVSAVRTQFASGDVDATLSYEYRSSRYAEILRRLTYGPGDLDYTDFIEGYLEDGWLPTYLSAGDFTGITLNMSYDDGGRLDGWWSSTHPGSAEFRYDGNDRLTRAVYRDGAEAVLVTLTWEYTPGGLRASYSDGTLDDVYSTDAAGRLISATHEHPANDDEMYSYDRAGNRRVEGLEAQYVYDAANQLLQDETYIYTYDANGNRQTRDLRTGGALIRYEYDSENRLTGVTLPSGEWVRFAYDPLGRLVEKEDSSGLIRRYVYDRDEVLAEFDGLGNMVRRYVTRDGIDMLVGLISDGDHYVVGTDSLGTVIGFLDTTGSPAGAYQYQAFGAIVNVDGSVQNERTFAGRDYDGVSGLYQVRTRFYDPGTGQFLQRDPIPYKAALAAYSYAANNPVSYRDPYGLDAFNEGVGLGRFLYKRAGEPLLQNSIERAAEWYVTGAIDELTENTGFMSGLGSEVGGRVGTGIGIAFQFKDILKIAFADDPLQAGIDWYRGEPWNPVTDEMLDAFLTMGGTMPRHEPRMAPVCTSSTHSDRLFEVQLQSSRTLAQRR
jgi:RHS repeat-associated protein